MKENIKYLDKRTANLGQDRPIVTEMHIPNAASSTVSEKRETQVLCVL